MNYNQFPHLSCVWSDPLDWDALDANILPKEPGYYAFTDHPGALLPSIPGKSVLYVGTTQNLRKRIKKYKTGDTTGLANMHRGGLMLLLSRASAAHYDGGRLTHSVQRTPVSFTVKATATKPAQNGVLPPDVIYIRWALDYRAAIEALLIRQLNPKFNTMLV